MSVEADHFQKLARKIDIFFGSNTLNLLENSISLPVSAEMCPELSGKSETSETQKTFLPPIVSLVFTDYVCGVMSNPLDSSKPLSGDPAPQDALDSLRRELVEVATRLFMRLGFKSVTMDDIAREMGRSKKTLYQVVSNKQELVDMVLDADMAVDEHATREAKHHSQDAIEEMLLIAKHFVASLRDMRPVVMYDLQKYYRSTWKRVDCHHREQGVGSIQANIDRGKAEGLYRQDVDSEIIAQLFAAAPKTFLEPGGYEVKEGSWPHVLRQFISYHLRGIASPKGLKLLDQYLSEAYKTL